MESTNLQDRLARCLSSMREKGLVGHSLSAFRARQEVLREYFPNSRELIQVRDELLRQKAMRQQNGNLDEALRLTAKITKTQGMEMDVELVPISREEFRRRFPDIAS